MTTTELPIPKKFGNRINWLKARQERIQASDSAALFGVGHNDQSIVALYESKVMPLTEDDVSEDRFIVGQMIEPTLRKLFTHYNDLACHEPIPYSLYQHPTKDHIGATLDGLTQHDEYGTIPVELKNVGVQNRVDWSEGNCPLKYQIQCQHQMLVTGAPAAYLFALIGGNEPVTRLILRNPRFLAALETEIDKFWGYVQRRELPPVDGSEATSKALARLYADAYDAEVLLPPEAEEWDSKLAIAKEAIKTAEATKTEIENKIKAAMGNHTIGQIPGGGRFTWKEQTNQYPAREAYQSTFRVLRRVK
jgi:putative phage-type endonuclease